MPETPQPPQSPPTASKPTGRLGRMFQTIRYWKRAFVRDFKLGRWERSVYHTAKELDPRVEFTGPKLGFQYYYQRGFLPAYPKKDQKGFAIIEVYGKWHRQPLTHCHWTMQYFHDYLESGKDQDKLRFLQAVDLLMEARTTATLGEIVCDLWYFDFEVPACAPHRLPWTSALVQGWAVAVLARAWQMTGNEEYLQAARNASAVYDVDVADGGIRSTDDQGNIYYEEYPFSDGGHHVLNGFISAIVGVYDLYRATGDERAKRLFEQGINTLKAPGVLERYDLGYWSAYDQYSRRDKKPMTLHYNRIHVRQLTVLYKVTGEDLFRRTADKWYNYGLSRMCVMRNSWVTFRYRLRQVPRYLRKLMGR